MRRAMLAALCCVLAACATKTPGDDALYNQLGGETGINLIVDDLLFLSTRDRRIGEFFDGVDLERLHGLLSEQVCALSGGPCLYSGETMAESHRGMGVDEAAFNALVENLVDAMEAQSVPVAAQNRLLALLAPMQRDIVAR